MEKKGKGQSSQEERELTVISDIQSYIKLVLENAINGNFVYRGHASKEWTLKSSIGRNDNYSKDLEKEIFLQFKKNFYSYTTERPKSDMDLLFLAQHYGLPTRLLDFTFNPMIALYFACEKVKEKEKEMDGRVYFWNINNQTLKDADLCSKAPHSIDEVFSIKRASFVVPNYTDARYKNQKALFLLSDQPEKEFTFISDSYIVKKEYKEQMRHDLAILGYDKTLVYPLLDSLCYDIKERNGLK